MRLACLLLAAAACGGHHALADARVDDAASFDASTQVDAHTTITGGRLLVTESPPGPANGDPATWGGVLVYRIDVDGATAIPEAGIPKDQVHDPVDVLYRAASAEVLVANRHGNNAADGVAGSISRFTYDPMTGALVASGEITGNGLSGVHQLALSPTTGELFAANVDAGVSRFTFDAAGHAIANGTISDGPTRGVAVSPDGARLYVTTAAAVIRQFDLTTGNELATVTVDATANLHFFAERAGQLYVPGLDSNKVYRLTIGANDDLTVAGTVDVPSSVGVAFSESGREMFVTGHRTSDVIARFAYDAAHDAWTPAADVTSTGSLGGVVMLPIR